MPSRRLRLAGLHALPGAARPLLRGRPRPTRTARCARPRGAGACSPRPDRGRRSLRRRVAARARRGRLPGAARRAGRDAADNERALVARVLREERRFADDDLELARNLTGAARGALERSELFEAERRARALAQQLARTGSALATELDPAAVLDEVVRRRPRCSARMRRVLRLLEGDELVVGAVGGDGADALEARLPSTAGLAGDAVQSRAPVAVADARGTTAPAPGRPGARRGLCGLPRRAADRARGTVHGVLSVYSRAPRAWREDEIEALGRSPRTPRPRSPAPSSTSASRSSGSAASRSSPTSPTGSSPSTARATSSSGTGRRGDHRRPAEEALGRSPARSFSATSSPPAKRPRASASSRSAAAARRSGSR